RSASAKANTWQATCAGSRSTEEGRSSVRRWARAHRLHEAGGVEQAREPIGHAERERLASRVDRALVLLVHPQAGAQRPVVLQEIVEAGGEAGLPLLDRALGAMAGGLGGVAECRGRVPAIAHEPDEGERRRERKLLAALREQPARDPIGLPARAQGTVIL